MIGRYRRLYINLLIPIRLWLIPLVLVLVLVAASPALAQGTGEGELATQTPRSPTLRIVDQNTFVAADGSLELIVEFAGLDELQTDGGQDLVISTVIYGQLLEESEVDGSPGTPLARHSLVPLESLEPAGENRFRVTVPIRSSERFDGQERALLRQPGVYPITLELRDPQGPVASVRTHLVRLPVETSADAQESPIPLSVVLTISTAEGLTVADVVELLTTHPMMPLTVLLGPGVLNQLQEEPDETASLVAALNGRPVLASPTIDLDPSAMAEIGQSELFLNAANADREVLIGLGLRPAQGVGLLEAPLTAEGISTITELGWQAVLKVDPQRSTSVRVVTGEQPFTVIRPDVELTSLLDRSPLTGLDDGSFRANRVLSRLVLRGVGDDEAVVLGGPALGLDAKDALAEVLEALAQPGGPRPVPLSDVGAGPTERPAERPAQDLRGVADRVADLRTQLSTLSGFAAPANAVPTAPTASLTGQVLTTSPVLSNLSPPRGDPEQRLAAALTRQRNPLDRERAIDLLSHQIADEFAAIHVHEPQPVTVAARNAGLPVVIDNSAGESRLVLLRLRSDGLVSPDDGRLVEVGPGNSSIEVEVEARSLGVSLLEVSVWTPDESVRLASTQFQVRSTAVPGLGVAVSLVACALLAVWWWIDRSRKVATSKNAIGTDTLG